MPPLFTEPGFNLHTPDEIGVDSFQADRSPTRMYRTAPLGGFFTHAKGAITMTGDLQPLQDVADHYDQMLKTGLTSDQKSDLIAWLNTL